LALGTLALAGVLQLPVSAFAPTVEAAPASQAEAEALTEEVLLLEAMRYLGLSVEQLRQLQPVAAEVAEDLQRARRTEAPLLAQLERNARRQREALLDGTKTPVGLDVDAVLVRRLLLEQQEQAAAQIIRRIAPRIAQILTRPQLRRAFLLLHDAVPETEVVPRSLLEPSSGFVLSDRDREDWKRTAIQESLFRRYPRRAVSQSFDSGAFGNFNIITGQIEPAEFPDELLAAIRRDRSELDARWNRLVDGGLTDASGSELAIAVQPLVKRLLLSPRFRGTLDEKIRRADGERQ
jgi:hypothetical protein